MRTPLLLSALLATVLLATISAQAPTPAPASLAERLVARALDDDHAHALLRALLAAAPTRLAGSPGMVKARTWAVATMRTVGLTDVREEPVMVPQWRRGKVATLRYGEQSFAIAALGGSVATAPGGLRAKVLMVRSFEELHARAEEAKGKIVFFNRPMPRVLRSTFHGYRDAVPQRSSGAIEAGKVGAVAALVRSVTTQIDDLPHTGAMRYDPATTKVPAAAISTLGAEALAQRLQQDPQLELHLELDCTTGDDLPCANVVGELRGTTHPDEIVLIGAHLDAWDLGHGAHDDGAGVAHCLEAVRLLRACGVKPARTLRVVLFANEEFGLRGATGYEAAHHDELTRHVAAVETDNGGADPRGFSSNLPETARGNLAAAMAPLRALGMGALIDGGGGADIGPLGKHGVPLFGMVVNDQRYFDYHHCAADTLAAVNNRELALGAASLAHFASLLLDQEVWKR
jgi:carboxypeptidase Q